MNHNIRAIICAVVGGAAAIATEVFLLVATDLSLETVLLVIFTAWFAGVVAGCVFTEEFAIRRRKRRRMRSRECNFVTLTKDQWYSRYER